MDRVSARKGDRRGKSRGGSGDALAGSIRRAKKPGKKRGPAWGRKAVGWNRGERPDTEPEAERRRYRENARKTSSAWVSRLAGMLWDRNEGPSGHERPAPLCGVGGWFEQEKIWRGKPES